ncbi:MAG: CBS domain-containing protein [Planctomycetia bacterium]|nr:CBS domain-containing protein [Planctomycetia bacterium]
MSVGRICTREVDLAQMDESVWQAAERMHQRAVGTLVVIDDDKKPIGIVTDRDLVERVLAKFLDPGATTVGQVMTQAPETVSEQDAIEHAITVMRRERCRRLPVVDDKGELVGLLSLDDVLQLLAEELTSVGELLERQTPQAAAQN